MRNFLQSYFKLLTLEMLFLRKCSVTSVLFLSVFAPITLTVSNLNAYDIPSVPQAGAGCGTVPVVVIGASASAQGGKCGFTGFCDEPGVTHYFLEETLVITTHDVAMISADNPDGCDEPTSLVGEITDGFETLDWKCDPMNYCAQTLTRSGEVDQLYINVVLNSDGTTNDSSGEETATVDPTSGYIAPWAGGLLTGPLIVGPTLTPDDDLGITVENDTDCAVDSGSTISTVTGGASWVWTNSCLGTVSVTYEEHGQFEAHTNLYQPYDDDLLRSVLMSKRIGAMPSLSLGSPQAYFEMSADDNYGYVAKMEYQLEVYESHLENDYDFEWDEVTTPYPSGQPTLKHCTYKQRGNGAELTTPLKPVDVPGQQSIISVQNSVCYVSAHGVSDASDAPVASSNTPGSN